MASDPLFSTERWNVEQVLHGPDDIRACNLQRFEMEQLDAVTHLDLENGEIVGIKHVSDDEFWVRGHVPGRPLLPGVLMLEALAQLTSFFIKKSRPEIPFIGFGGVNDVKFRQTVKPGDRLVLVGRAKSIRRRRAIFDTQGWVGDALAVEAEITGLQV